MKIERANRNDVETIIAMIADDPLGSKREKYELPLPKTYIEAFHRINADKNQELMVVRNESAEIIGTFQLTFIPYLTYQGRTRAQIECVRVHKKYRGTGIGTYIFDWAIQKAKERNAHLLQLTTDKQRPDSIRFYESLGFKASHEGMKLHLQIDF